MEGKFNYINILLTTCGLTTSLSECLDWSRRVVVYVWIILRLNNNKWQDFYERECVKRQPTDKGSEYLEVRVDVYLWADFSRKFGPNP